MENNKVLINGKYVDWDLVIKVLEEKMETLGSSESEEGEYCALDEACKAIKEREENAKVYTAEQVLEATVKAYQNDLEKNAIKKAENDEKKQKKIKRAEAAEKREAHANENLAWAYGEIDRLKAKLAEADWLVHRTILVGGNFSFASYKEWLPKALKYEVRRAQEAKP